METWRLFFLVFATVMVGVSVMVRVGFVVVVVEVWVVTVFRQRQLHPADELVEFFLFALFGDELGTLAILKLLVKHLLVNVSQFA